MTTSGLLADSATWPLVVCSQIPYRQVAGGERRPSVLVWGAPHERLLRGEDDRPGLPLWFPYPDGGAAGLSD